MIGLAYLIVPRTQMT